MSKANANNEGGEVKMSGGEIGTFDIVRKHSRGWPSETSQIPKGMKWDERWGETVKERRRGARVTKSKVTQGRIRALESKGARDEVSRGGESEE